MGDWPRLTRSRFGVRRIPDDDPRTPLESIFALTWMLPSAMLMRRGVFDAVGGWDEEFGQPFEDTNLFLHLALRGDVLRLPRDLVRHRRHDTQNTSQQERISRQRALLFERWRDVSKLPPEHAAAIRDAWRFRERRVIPHQAVTAARRLAAEGERTAAVKFLAGGLRIAATSLVLGPGRGRPKR
jgi:GT2 family glycosyltransferase